MSPLLLASVWTASLLGSLHCVGMCGPFVGVYSGAVCGSSSHGGKGPAGHLAYHGGRLLTYVALGAAAGGLGAAVNFVFDSRGWVEMAALGTSCVLIASGFFAFLPDSFRLRFFRRGLTRLGQAPAAKRVLLRIGTAPRVVRGGTLGLLTPLLPCGWLYAFALVAGGSGGVLSGMAVMAVFWAGTVPALLGLGVLIGKVSVRLRSRLPAILGAVWIVVGLLGLVSRAQTRVTLQETFLPASGAAPTERPHCH